MEYYFLESVAKAIGLKTINPETWSI